MLQKAIDILKARWQEVMLVVILQAAMMYLAQEISTLVQDAESQKTVFPFGTSFLLLVGMVTLFSIWQMLYLGFLRTAAIQGQTGQQPAQLLRHGRPYFWRYLFFYIQINCLIFLLGGIVISIFASAALENPETEMMPDWFMQSCILGVSLGLIKPLLFIPARIIVYKNTTLEALFSVSFYRMDQIPHLNRSIAVGFAVLLAGVAYTFFPEGTAVHYIFSGVYHLLCVMVMLFLTLLVVLGVQEEYNVEQRKYNEKENVS